MKDLQESGITKLAQRGVSINDIAEGARTFLIEKYHDAVD